MRDEEEEWGDGALGHWGIINAPLLHFSKAPAHLHPFSLCLCVFSYFYTASIRKEETFMLFRSLIVFMMLAFISSSGWANNILFYVLSDRTDSGGWYTDPKDPAMLVEPVKKDGHSVKVEDKTTIDKLTLAALMKYDQTWILEGDEDSNVEVSAEDADALFSYYRQGRVVWISTEEAAWTEDANVFLEKFGIEIESGIVGGASPPVSGDHPILAGVKSLRFDDGVGALKTGNRDIKVIWEYPSNAGKKSAIAVLDKEGYAVFDSGWVAGYAYRPEAQNDSNIQFAMNIAKISPKLAVDERVLAAAWGYVKSCR